MPRPRPTPPPPPATERQPSGRRRRAKVGQVLAAGLVLTVPLVLAAPARAEDPTSTEAGGTDGIEGTDVPRHLRQPAPVIIVDDPRVDPDLGAVPLEGEDYDRAVAAYLATQQRRDQAAETFNHAVTELTDLLAAKTRLASERNVAIRRKAKAENRLRELRGELKGVAVDGYVRGGLGGPIEGSFDVEEALVNSRRRVYVSTLHGDQLAEQRLNLAVLDEMTTTLARTEAEQRAVDDRIARVSETRDRAAEDREQATTQLSLDKRAVADTRLLARVVDLDYSLVVFNAYYRAAKLSRATDPGCGLRWQALAGIGRTESHHGTYAGGYVDADGNLTVPIYGPVLDGSNGTAVIKDSDDGELDGRDDIDRAVGPMQFIPTTWRAFARDGDGDGRADPQNYYDTNLTAAAYLCRQGPGLDTDDGLRRAFRSYNNDGGYVAQVLSNTHEYDGYVIPAISGDTGPPLPPPSSSTTSIAPTERPTTTVRDTPSTTATTVRPSTTTTAITSTSTSASTTEAPSTTATSAPAP